MGQPTTSTSHAEPAARVWIDVGGTFTDCILCGPDGALRTHKLLSSGVYRGAAARGSSAERVIDPQRRDDPPGFFAGWRIALRVDGGWLESRVAAGPGARATGVGGVLWLDPPLAAPPPVGALYELSCGLDAPVIGARWLLGAARGQALPAIDLRLGTTRGTNALLERKGAATALGLTAGLGDLVRIGYQARPRLFDLHIRLGTPLYREVVEIAERVAADGRVLRALDEEAVLRDLCAARERGVESLAVCLLNSYRNPGHERSVARLARRAGFEYVALSSELSPEQRVVPRAETAIVDAYLGPITARYVSELRAGLPTASIRMMTSAGSLVRAADFRAKDSILSGPAAGVVGAAASAAAVGCERLIALDMGGTSTDVSRFDGEFERRGELLIEDAETGGHTRVRAPVLAIETIAAGGGSLCGFDGVKPTVGPDSAGAAPGPACYGRGGPLCLTDVNLLLGRLPEPYFPMPLDRGAAEAALRGRVEEIRSATGKAYSPLELAAGYVAIANAHMAAALRRVTIERGCDPRDHALVCLGGAGGQHACALARELGLTQIIYPPLPGFLSALGIGHAPIARHASCDVGRPLDELPNGALHALFAELEQRARREIAAEGVSDELEAPCRRLDLRYEGQDAVLTIAEPADGDWRLAFTRAHEQLAGFVLERPVEVRAARVELRSRGTAAIVGAPARGGGRQPQRSRANAAPAAQVAWFDGAPHQAALHDRAELGPGARVRGPALIAERGGTLVIEPGWEAEVHALGHVLLRPAADAPGDPASARAATAERNPAARQRTGCDPVTLELFNRGFAAVAEQMGTALARTAVSTNVKERLDFSCAVFDARGGLVANAAHIPVHLGAMGHAARCLLEDLERAGTALRPGDAYLTNDPYRGGSHLPDVTVITPVFDEDGERLLMLLANRAHHAEIGGITPGSMPPGSTTLAEEGVVMRNLRIVRRAGGRALFDEPLLRGALSSGPHPSRSVEQNLADVRAQIAANQVGSGAIARLLARFGESTVLRYMGYMQDAAEALARAALRGVGDGEYALADRLDDGTPIAVRIRIRDGRAEFDFSGSGPVSPANLNATPAIVASAVLYCVRCLIGRELPLNAGLLAPLTIRIPPGVLNPPAADDPARCAAVAAGNVETSQRIVDCVLGALGLAAASQGTMNNLTFGDERFGYYETIAGGAGAGPGFDGASAVHTHMTNTRLTDPEVLEERYPVRLRRFAIRAGSGGTGRWRGGDGVIREIEFLAPQRVAIISERRTCAPFGLAGGQAGASGRNTLLRADGTCVRLGGRADFAVNAGDVVRIETPGGGGYGA
ncbi:MAG: hydantoinase B/oxoprolinase family protein [Phycisphaerae bacterium]|nr:hydantoinase B/oxoprolinase family protein [Phycisphaerae bacterium]MCZ2399158.1 hydantoinase B/oxoprolinase family protein [Phycisphaerae bacterium]